MSITNTLNSVQNSLSSLTSSLSNVVNSATSAANTDFSALLSQATATTTTAPTAPNPAAGKADFVSGRLGVSLDRGIPAYISYFDESGNELKRSGFSATSLIQATNDLGIDRNDLIGLGQKLDAAGVGYKPYELYPGTGSDHGINFDDVIAGGMGTAYDWTKDSNAALKDAFTIGTAAEGSAVSRIAAARTLADSLGIVKNNQVTTERGIDPNRLTSLLDGAGQTVSHVVYTGGTASWYASAQAAQQAQASIGGTTLDLTDVAVPNVYLEQAAAEATPANAGGVSPATPATPASPPVATESNPVSNESSSAASVASQASPTTPASAVTALQEQINQLTSGISSGTNTPMSSFMNSYNQLQALMAKMTDLQKTLAAA